MDNMSGDMNQKYLSYFGGQKWVKHLWEANKVFSSWLSQWEMGIGKLGQTMEAERCSKENREEKVSKSSFLQIYVATNPGKNSKLAVLCAYPITGSKDCHSRY